MQKSDIDSFFTASDKKPFTHRIIISTTSLWSEHAEEALRGQHTPVTKIHLIALENSFIDWSHYASKEEPTLRQKKSLRPHQRVADQEQHEQVSDVGYEIKVRAPSKNEIASSWSQTWSRVPAMEPASRRIL